MKMLVARKKWFLVYSMPRGREVYYPFPEYANDLEDHLAIPLGERLWSNIRKEVITASNPRLVKLSRLETELLEIKSTVF